MDTDTFDYSSIRSTTDSRKLSLFVSYSRTDITIADQLIAALTALGYAVTIDRTGIHGAERWQERLGQMILEADAVVFLLSPTSAASKVCAWEVDQALALNKRIVPVVAKPFDEATPHEALKDLNYIHLIETASVPRSGWGTGLAKLDAALSVDIDWVRDHTRVMEQARRWAMLRQSSTSVADQESQASAAMDVLARGAELERLKAWRSTRPSNAPALTDLQRAYIAASEDIQAKADDAERKQLAEIASAQAERTKALDDREAAQAREAAQTRRANRLRNLVMLGTLLFGAGIGATGLYAWDKRDEAIAEKNKAVAAKDAVDRLIGRIYVGRDNVHGWRAMTKACGEAAVVTARLAADRASSLDSPDGRLFLELYYGNMNLAEMRQQTQCYNGDVSTIVASSIESAMVAFKRGKEGGAQNLLDLAKDVARECTAYMTLLESNKGCPR